MFLLQVACTTSIINESADSWNKRDQEVYERAVIRCGELYGNSCVKTFIKTSKYSWKVECS